MSHAVKAGASSLASAGGILPMDSRRRRLFEPVDPFESGELHGFEVSPRPSAMDGRMG